MKNKIVVIIIIILILGFIGYKKFIEVPGNVAGQIAIEELMKQVYHEEADKHLEKIYIKNGTVADPLPVFDDINNAPEDWIWMVLYNNLKTEENSYTYDQIEEELNLLFGENFQKNFPEEGIENLIEKDKETGNYSKIEIVDNNKEYMYSIKSSIQEDNTYRVNILEYVIIEDKENYSYSLLDKDNNEIKKYTYNDENDKNEIREQIKSDVNKENYNMNGKEIKMEIKDVNKIKVISIKNN